MCACPVPVPPAQALVCSCWPLPWFCQVIQQSSERVTYEQLAQGSNAISTLGRSLAKDPDKLGLQRRLEGIVSNVEERREVFENAMLGGWATCVGTKGGGV